MKRVLFVVMLLCSVYVFPGWSYSEPYLSGYAGGAFPHKSDAADNTGLAIAGDLSFNAGVAVGAKGGYWFSEQGAPYLGLELDLNGHFAETDKLSVPVGGITVNANVDADVTVVAFTANALIRYPEGPLRPYAGVGIGSFFGDISNGTLTVLGVTTQFAGADDTTFGGQILVGADWLFNPNVSAFVEYKYSMANFEFGGDVGLDVDYRVSQIYVGVAYHF